MKIWTVRNFPVIKYFVKLVPSLSHEATLSRSIIYLSTFVYPVCCFFMPSKREGLKKICFSASFNFVPISLGVVKKFTHERGCRAKRILTSYRFLMFCNVL